MTETALASAFAAVGWKSSSQKALDMAIAAWAKFPRDADGQARREFVTNELRGEMTFAIIEAWDRSVLGMAIGQLLNRAADVIRSQKPRDASQDAGSRHPRIETHVPFARPTNSGTKPEDDGRTIGNSEPIGTSPSVVTNMRDAGASLYGGRTAVDGSGTIPRSPSAVTTTSRATTILAGSVALSRLDTFRLPGWDMSIGEMTPNQARSWARNNAITSRWVELLTANLPPNDPIKKWRNAEDAENLWIEAQKAAARWPETIDAA